MRFFFYGTLIDPDVRRIVMGSSNPADVSPALLKDWERRAVVGESWPTIRRKPGAVVDGVLVRGINERAYDSLIVYESEGFDIIDVPVQSLVDRKIRQARMFLLRSTSGLQAADTSWRYETWVVREKARFLVNLKSSY
jgi:hypothetical protein